MHDITFSIEIMTTIHNVYAKLFRVNYLVNTSVWLLNNISFTDLMQMGGAQVLWA